MSCNCQSTGAAGLPPSVQVGIIAIELAIKAGAGAESSRLAAVADTILRTILGGEDNEARRRALDRGLIPDVPKTGSGPREVILRNVVVNGPLTWLRDIRDEAIDSLEREGIRTVGQLMMMTPDQVNLALGHAFAADRVNEVMGRMGMRLGMTAEQVQAWILEGSA